MQTSATLAQSDVLLQLLQAVEVDDEVAAGHGLRLQATQQCLDGICKHTGTDYNMLSIVGMKANHAIYCSRCRAGEQAYGTSWVLGSPHVEVFIRQKDFEEAEKLQTMVIKSELFKVNATLT
jgi:flavoprotein